MVLSSIYYQGSIGYGKSGLIKSLLQPLLFLETSIAKVLIYKKRGGDLAIIVSLIIIISVSS